LPLLGNRLQTTLRRTSFASTALLTAR
jgi:hypothetical protein